MLAAEPNLQNRPSVIRSLIIFILSIAFMAWLRLIIFPDQVVPLTYGLPLLLCYWQRDRRLLWSMVLAFIVMSAFKNLYLIPKINSSEYNPVMWLMQMVNILLIGGVIHVTLALMEKLHTSNQRLATANEELQESARVISRQNEDLLAQAEELKRQTEELQSQAEEMEQQNEELQQQGEELEQQSEELQQQNEELQALNAESSQRERMLQTMLHSMRNIRGEQEVLRDICDSMLLMSGDAACAGAIIQRDGENMLLSASAGLDGTARASLPYEQTFARIIMESGCTGFVDDLLARPDIITPCPQDMNVRSILVAPLRIDGICVGAVEMYSQSPRHWNSQEFALAEWVAAQCAMVISMIRLQGALRTAKDELEKTVSARTSELRRTVTSLRNEIDRREEAEQELRRYSDQLRSMATELTLVEQRERQQLARILHDGLQQLLVGARLRLGIAARRPEQLPQVINEINNLLNEAIETSRSLTAELSPPILREGGLVPALEWLVRWMANKHELAVALEIKDQVDPQEDLTITLFQAVRELLFNVVKHAGVQQASLLVRKDGNAVQIVVEDSGRGFNPEQLKPGEGSKQGFGLFSIRERLNLLGGALECESTPGEGSRFILSAPLEDQDEIDLDAMIEQSNPSITPFDPDPETSERGQIRIVLVDDHRVMRQGLAMLIEEQNDMRVVGEASSGESAIRIVQQLKPDLVLMDISMPGMGGIEATQVIRQLCPDVQVIGLSMFEEEDRAQAICSAGAVAYLTKSGRSEDLIATIRNSIQQQRLTS